MRVKCESECVIDDSRKDSQLFTDRNADRDLCRVHFEELSCVSEKNNDGWKRRGRECSPINATKTDGNRDSIDHLIRANFRILHTNIAPFY